MKRILIVFGTRPEAIKMAPLIREFKKYPDKFDTKVCVTAQHRNMLDQVLAFFDINPDFDLDLMRPNQNLYDLTAAIISELRPVLEDFNPDFVFVHGDTTTTMAASISAFYAGAKVCHVESGLRTNNKFSPFPEEINRQITSRISEYHFAPTSTSKQNLLLENIDEKSILITGNTVIDSLLESKSKVHLIADSEIEKLKVTIDLKKKIILITGHRRENHGQGFFNICMALKRIALDFPDVQLIYPVHLNPNVQKTVLELLGGISNIILLPPLAYPAFVWLMDKSFLIITDSGGVQEEAPSLGKPVLVMRDTTERPEAVESGTVILVGTDSSLIYEQTILLLNDSVQYKKMSELHNPYGDGKASERIVQFILNLEK